MNWLQFTGHFNCTREEKQRAFKTVKKLVQWSELVRAEGFLAMEDIAEAEKDIFLKHGLLFVLDGATQEEWERYAAAWILADQAKGERLLEMAIMTEGLSLILEQKRPQAVLIHLGAWLGSDLAAEAERELKTVKARHCCKPQERRLQSSLPGFDQLPRFAPDVLRKVISDIDEKTLTVALKGASEKAYQAIMQGVPPDRHDEIVKGVDLMVNIRLCDVVKAQRYIWELLEQETASKRN